MHRIRNNAPRRVGSTPGAATLGTCRK